VNTRFVHIGTSLCLAALACGDRDQTTTTFNPEALPGTGEPRSGSLLTPELPPDVDRAEQARLTSLGQYPAVQHLFDALSWQSFIALNWPRTARGEPAAMLTDPGSLFWETYSESYEVFKPEGAPPDPYGSPRQTLPPIDPTELVNRGNDVLEAQGHRLLFNLSSTGNLNVLDEVNQAFSSPLWDQNGNVVHYEVLLNRVEYDYITQNELYNLQGQVAFFAQHGAAQFPAGSFTSGAEGAIEIKLAWRVLTDADIRSRYLTRPAFIIAGEPASWVEVQAGLVGMHIANKTESSPQWIWSTFEHVDNLNVDASLAFGPDGASHPKAPSFYDPSCEYCPVNVLPKPDADSRYKTQVSRAVEIPKATAAFNAEMQALLAGIGSPLQYYELINTQWPTEPSAPPAPIDVFPENITNKSGGKPAPVFLTNSVMETYFQSGASAQRSVQLVVDGQDAGTIPSTNGGNTPLEHAEGFCGSVGDDCGDAGQNLVLSTESCMGCHSSAGIATARSESAPNGYTFGGQLSADFSWLLQQKAQPRAE
jgi:hypothetical protein